MNTGGFAYERNKNMHKNVILVAETGSDITYKMAEELGIYLVPMHVTMGGAILDDGTFPPEDVCKYYDETGKCPTTAGSTPFDFEKVLDEIHAAHPDKKILHLAYSAVTTCSYQSCIVASENRDYVKSVDTKHVSVGQAAVVIAVKKYLDEHPDATLEEAADYAVRVGLETKMCFIPKNLDYLRAGGRVSNAAHIVGTLLSLVPCIEILDGKLMATKKYRGNFKKIVPKLIEEYKANNNLDKKHVYLITTPHLSREIEEIAEETVKSLGFENFTWMKTGCVITCHGGPGAFGMVGTTK